jgi:hypothetical protein
MPLGAEGRGAATGMVNRSLDPGGRLVPAEPREPCFPQKKGQDHGMLQNGGDLLPTLLLQRL